uniref:methanethiol S-methyltransferase n=1 Tax=uncultured Sphingomonas sp. TaxID=158754 RepID=UPI0035CA66B8
MTRGIFLATSLVCYGLFLATFLYLIGFVGGFAVLPRTVDFGPAAPAPLAIAGDLALIAVFGLQHSVMARPGFKRRWARIVPPVLERSIYVLLASLVLILLFAGWRPIPIVLWAVADPVGTPILWALFATGWGIVLASTYMINHFELFGLSQTWAHFRGRQPGAARFVTPIFYRVVRHPLYSGFLLAFWATPVMTVGHLVLALGMTAYVLIAIWHEERDLVDMFGDEYRDYRARVGMLAPGIGRRSA